MSGLKEDRLVWNHWQTSIGEEPQTLEDVYEPYLLQIGLIKRTPRGRIVTELGYKHFNLDYHSKLD